MEIQSTTPGVTVILYRRTPRDLVAYGHGADMGFPGACRKAAIEMDRHASVLERLFDLHEKRGGELLSAQAHPMEQRSLYFATKPGHERFLERLRTKVTAPAPVPKLVFDGEIPGPWSAYAHVWRVVYEPPSRHFCSREPDYFWW